MSTRNIFWGGKTAGL